MMMETLEYLGIAFVCSVLLIIMSKIILQSLIRRPADYYDAEELRQEELMLNAGGISLASEHETTPEGEIMEDTHLEAHTTGDIKAAEPEEIFAEISESVTESIESEQPAEEELDFDTDDETGVFIDEISEIEHEPEVIEGSGPEPETEPEPAEKAEEISESAEEAEPEVVSEAEPEAGAETEPEIIEEPESEVAEEPEPEAGEEPEHQAEEKPEEAEETQEPETESESESESGLAPYEFKIKARTTRERKPIKPVKKAEEEAKEEAQEKASQEEAQEPEGWTESYDEIRSSLEQAYTRKKKSNRRRKPSMNMNKTELISIAESMGISIPEDATKRIILGLIYEEKKNGRNHR